MKLAPYLKIVRASGWYDLIVTWPFATPWTFVWLYANLAVLAQSLGLPGTVHPLDATHVMLANLLGSVALQREPTPAGSPVIASESVICVQFSPSSQPSSW